MYTQAYLLTNCQCFITTNYYYYLLLLHTLTDIAAALIKALSHILYCISLSAANWRTASFRGCLILNAYDLFTSGSGKISAPGRNSFKARVLPLKHSKRLFWIQQSILFQDRFSFRNRYLQGDITIHNSIDIQTLTYSVTEHNMTLPIMYITCISLTFIITICKCT